MVTSQIKNGSGGCLSFEELNSIVSVLSAFGVIFSHPVFYVRYAGLESVSGVVIMFWTK